MNATVNIMLKDSATNDEIRVIDINFLTGNSAQTDHCFSRQIDHQKLTHNLMM